jgi:hypothetical protein
MANNFDSGTPHVVIPVLHPSGEVHNLAVPEGTPLSDLHDALNDAGYATPLANPQPTAAGAIENSDQFRNQSDAAWKAVNKGFNTYAESGFSVGKDGNAGPLRTEVTPRMPGQTVIDRDKINFKTSDLGVVHTHPDNSVPGPSQNDIAAAKKIGKTIWVTSQGGLYSVEKDGNVTRIFKSENWMNEPVKKGKT